jgi:hypothetical protein
VPASKISAVVRDLCRVGLTVLYIKVRRVCGIES